jgi:hypothetical protein
MSDVQPNIPAAGQINSRLRIIRPVAWFGYFLGGLGFLLFFTCFKYPFSLGLQEGLTVIAGIGIGLSLQVPMLILQAAMPFKEMAAATASWTLTRSLGGSIGESISISSRQELMGRSQVWRSSLPSSIPA